MPPKKGNKGSSSSNEVNTFPSSSRYSRSVFEQYAARKDVLIEKTLDLGYVMKFIPNYVETLKEWGWIDLLKTKKYVMPEIVKHFYFFGEDKLYDDKGVALGPRDNLELPTKLFNQKFVVSVDMINAIVGVNVSEGPRVMPKMNEVEKMEYLKVVFKKENIEKFPLELVKVSNFDVPERILHYVIAQSLFSRRRASEITDLDIYCMARIMKREPFNFGAFVISKMQEACVRVRGEKPYYCPFGKLITMICENLFGVDKLKNVARIEEDQGDALRDNIKLMRFEFDGLRQINPGFEELDMSIANALSGQGGPKRKRYQRKTLFEGLRSLGRLEGSSGDVHGGEAQEEAEMEDEEDNEDVKLTNDERLRQLMEQNNEILNHLRLKEEKDRKWREDKTWKNDVREWIQADTEWKERDEAWKIRSEERYDAFDDRLRTMEQSYQFFRRNRGEGSNGGGNNSGDGMEP